MANPTPTPIDQILTVTLTKNGQFQRVTIAASIALLTAGWQIFNPPTLPKPVVSK